MSARGPDTTPTGRARTLAAAAIRRPPSRGAERTAAKTGAPRGGVRGTQRMRLLAAAVGIVAERGYAQLTVTRAVARAGVSRETFYELFADREELFLAAFDDAVARIGAALERECAGEAAWQERVRAGLETVLVVLDEQPGLARLCVVEAPRAGARVLQRRAEILDGLAQIVEQGRTGGRGNGPPPLTAHSLVAGAASVVQQRLLTPAAGPLAELAGPLASMIVFPYRGPTAATRQLERPARKLERPVKL